MKKYLSFIPFLFLLSFSAQANTLSEEAIPTTYKASYALEAKECKNTSIGVNHILNYLGDKIKIHESENGNLVLESNLSSEALIVDNNMPEVNTPNGGYHFKLKDTDTRDITLIIKERRNGFRGKGYHHELEINGSQEKIKIEWMLRDENSNWHEFSSCSFVPIKPYVASIK